MLNENISLAHSDRGKPIETNKIGILNVYNYKL